MYYDLHVGGEVYDGIPVARLPIEAVDVPDVAHLRRSARYSGAVDIKPEHAIEAVFDPRRLVLQRHLFERPVKMPRAGAERSARDLRVLYDQHITVPVVLVARDPKSRTGEAIRVVGHSVGMNRVLVVLLVPDDHPPGGLWHVATAWPADSRTRDVYDGKESKDG